MKPDYVPENTDQKNYDPDISDDDLEFDDLDIDAQSIHGDEEDHADGCNQPLYVLPLYSLLSSDKQALVSGHFLETIPSNDIFKNICFENITGEDLFNIKII